MLARRLNVDALLPELLGGVEQSYASRGRSDLYPKRFTKTLPF